MNADSHSIVRHKLATVLPEWESAAIECVAEGQSRNSYLLTGPHGRALIKLDCVARDAFVNTREEEARIQTGAARRRIAPMVLFADQNCIVTEYLPGTVLSVGAIHEQRTLEQLGALLRVVHSLPRSGFDSNILAAANTYADAIEDAHMTARCLEVVAMAPATAEVLCHNDVVTGNILSADSLLLIDWEYARNHSPLFDLATVIAHHGLTADETRVLLDAYDRSGISTKALACYTSAYHALHWLWLASRKPQHPALAAIAAQI